MGDSLKRPRAFALAGILFITSCGSSSSPSTVVLDRADGDFFSRPFPRDDRKTAAGTIDLTGIPPQTGLLGTWVQALSTSTSGFGCGTGIFFRLSGELDPASLPATPEASVAADASVFVIDLDHDYRAPVLVNFSPYETAISGPNLLGIMPLPGIALAPGTRHAAIVTRRVKDKSGDAIGRDDGFSARLETPLYAPLREWITRSSALSLDDIVGATVFTTGDPNLVVAALRDAALRDLPTPTPTVNTHLAQASYDEYDGTYSTPIYLSGTPPYTREGGTMTFDGADKPVLHGMDTVRFMLGVPRTAAPTAGYPAIVYAHGSGGDRLQLFREVLPGGAPAAPDFTGAGFVVLGMDLTLHGDRMRDGVNGGTATSNFENLAGSRDMTRQSGVDEMVALRLMRGWPSALVLPGTGQTLKIDPERIVFMGFSRGAITGAMAMSREPNVRAVIFQGAGAHNIESSLGLTYPLDAKAFFELALNEDVDLFTPFLTLLATVLDPVDPQNFLSQIFAQPQSGVPSRSFLMQMGVDDTTVGVGGSRASVRAGRLPPVGVEHDPIAHLGLAGLQPFAPGPVMANGPGAVSTGALVQYKADGYNGHFVLVRHADTRRDWLAFARAAVETAGAPTFTP